MVMTERVPLFGGKKEASVECAGGWAMGQAVHKTYFRKQKIEMIVI